jgi:hypothetical protein
VKTTDGKTKPVAQGERTIRIYAEGHRGIIAAVSASSLRKALEQYYESTLKGYGYSRPKVVGNTLTVTTKTGPKMYLALETYQTP